jgi:cytochrome c-type biogenesis protein CcmH
MRRLFLALLVVLVVVPARAAVTPDEMLPDPKPEARARDLEKGLRCLVCQNQSIDDSDAALAHDISTVVRQQIEEGRSNQEIKAYLVSRYGSFILLQPPVTLATWALWFGPLVMLLLGSGLLIAFVRRRGEDGEPELSEAEQERLVELLSDEHPEQGR